jgi:hypothetical protein
MRYRTDADNDRLPKIGRARTEAWDLGQAAPSESPTAEVCGSPQNFDPILVGMVIFSIAIVCGTF